MSKIKVVRLDNFDRHGGVEACTAELLRKYEALTAVMRMFYIHPFSGEECSELFVIPDYTSYEIYTNQHVRDQANATTIANVAGMIRLSPVITPEEAPLLYQWISNTRFHTNLAALIDLSDLLAIDAHAVLNQEPQHVDQ